MNYTPEKQNHIAEWISLTLMLAAATAYLLSRPESALRWMLQVSSLVLLVCALQFLIRYSLTSFVYTLDEDNLIITKIVGKRKTVFCDLTLKMAVTVLDDGADYESRYGKAVQIYNCCVNLMPRDAKMFLFRFGSGMRVLRFQPDDAFLCEMRNRIEQYRGLNPDEDSPDSNNI